MKCGGSLWCHQREAAKEICEGILVLLPLIWYLSMEECSYLRRVAMCGICGSHGSLHLGKECKRCNACLRRDKQLWAWKKSMVEHIGKERCSSSMGKCWESNWGFQKVCTLVSWEKPKWKSTLEWMHALKEKHADLEAMKAMSMVMEDLNLEVLERQSSNGRCYGVLKLLREVKGSMNKASL